MADLKSFMSGVVVSGAIIGGSVAAQSAYEAPVAASVQLFAPNNGECRAYAIVPVTPSGESQPVRNANVELSVPCDNFARSLEGASLIAPGSWPDDAPALPFPLYVAPSTP